MSSESVVVVGAGLMGLCTAAALHQRGYDVRVIERGPDVGLETSFANGGMLTPSMSEPWNAPGVQWQLLKWIGRADAPMLLRPEALGHYLDWGVRFLASSTRVRYQAAIRANFLLSAYSMQTMRKLRAALDLHYCDARTGTLKIFRDQASLDASMKRGEALKDLGLLCLHLTTDQILKRVPLLATKSATIVGGIYYPEDEVGDAHLFCQALRSALMKRGVAIECGTTVTGFRTQGGGVVAVEIEGGEIAARCVVVAASAWSPALLKPLGIKLPVRPVKGYSLSVRLSDPALLPPLPIIDDDLHAAATPLGGMLRLAGTAEFCGWNARIDPARIETLWRFLKSCSPELFDAAHPDDARSWCGFRPMAADGRPYIGETQIRGLYVNTGHGHLGWTQAAGSGALMAAIIDGGHPPIATAPYSPLRSRA
ncbi:FAD-dependent oxidoreductase [Solimonas variicoloris]|uniref:FAD-dependent oxidoreductase n=1 Tax=Solimonas variicoloris TaxID=254408 RepID=UPI0004775FE5|nr:FAD-dependent oxidoreductase [Solimonas variicoloris]